jgi:hypothetical protein
LYINSHFLQHFVILQHSDSPQVALSQHILPDGHLHSVHVHPDFFSVQQDLVLQHSLPGGHLQIVQSQQFNLQQSLPVGQLQGLHLQHTLHSVSHLQFGLLHLHFLASI